MVRVRYRGNISSFSAGMVWIAFLSSLNCEYRSIEQTCPSADTCPELLAVFAVQVSELQELSLKMAREIIDDSSLLHLDNISQRFTSKDQFGTSFASIQCVLSPMDVSGRGYRYERVTGFL
ncbi:MAG: hypothetical protein JWO71_1540 [Candidatus Acidoferrum typicum]|nr:hypothetical protein [Candidatus Acidoferrum typicum]